MTTLAFYALDAEPDTWAPAALYFVRLDADRFELILTTSGGNPLRLGNVDLSIADIGGLVDALAAKQPALGFTPENVANKSIADGYAGLDADGRITSAMLPIGPTISGKITINGSTITASDPLISGSQTWNNAAVPFVGQTFEVTDTASATGSVIARWRRNNSDVVKIEKSGRIVSSEYVVSSGFGFWGSNDAGRFSLGTAQDVQLFRDAANTLAQRNGTNPQVFRLYNTYTDASNYERVSFSASSATGYTLAVEAAGTGSNRGLRLGIASIASGAQWFITQNGGHFFSTSDTAFDIGASGANRPRDLYIGRNITWRPAASVTPANNGELMLEATSNTSVTVKLKGSDGVVRSAVLTLA